MNRKAVWALLFVFALLVSLSAGTHIVKADFNIQVGSYKVVTILAPLNSTYNSRPLTLEVTFPSSALRYSLNYDIDGKYEGPVPYGIANPTEVHVVYEARGTVKLPELSDGSHRLTVTIECSVDIYGGNAPGAPFKPTTPNGTHFVATWADAVYFTIDSDEPNQPSSPPMVDSTPPTISILSPETNTYTSIDIPLNFTLNEQASNVSYCLDGENNIAIAGNTTLTGLSIGEHNLTIYAWDAVGNVGSSQTVNFAIIKETPTPSPTPEVSQSTVVAAASVVVAAGSGFGVLSYLIKHKH